MKRKIENEDGYEMLEFESTKTIDAPFRMRDWRALFTFVHRHHLPMLLPALLCSIAAGFLQPAMAIFFGRIFNSFAEFGAGKIDGNELSVEGSASIYYLLGLGAMTWIVKGSLFCLWLISSEMQTKAARDSLFESLLRKDQNWYDRRIKGIGSLLNRLQTYMRDFQTGTSQSLGLVCMYLVQAVASIGLSMYYNWRVTLVILSSVPVVTSIVLLIQAGIPAAIAAQETALDNASKAVHNTITNISMIVCFNAQSIEKGRYRKAVSAAAEHYCRQVRLTAVEVGFSRFGSTAVLLAGIYYGVTLVHQEKATVQAVTTTFWSCMSATQAVEDILPHLTILRKSWSAACALKMVIKDTIQEDKNDASLTGLCPASLEGDIQIQKMSFAYPPRPNHPILDNVTLFFPAGETTFVIGQSGSGKSTLGSLLLKFHQPSDGAIFMDGHSLHELDTNWLRNNITLVQQQSVLFDETLSRNITLGGGESNHDDFDRVQTSLEFSILSDDVSRLSNGVSTRVGTGGSALSGGQRQRVAIARAHFRNTPILILDESTSALDYISRTAVMRNLRQWRKGKTTIIVTHDLGQVMEKDFVYVLQQGRVVAEGYDAAATRMINQTKQPSDSRTQPSANTNCQASCAEAVEVKIQHKDSANISESPRELGKRAQAEDTFEEITVRIDIDGYALSQSKPMSLPHTPQDASLKRQNPAGTITQLPERAAMSFVTRTDLTNPRNRIYNGTQSERIQTRKMYHNRTMSIHHAVTMRSMNTKEQNESFSGMKHAESGNIDRRSIKPVPEQSKSGSVESNDWTLRRVLATVLYTLSFPEKYSLLGGIVSATAHAGVPALLSLVITKLFTTFYIQTNWQGEVRKYAIGMFAIAVGDGIAFYFMYYLLELAGQRWIDKTRIGAFERIVEQPIVWFEDTKAKSAHISSVLDQNAEEMRHLVGRFAAPLYVVTIMMTVSIIWALVKIWRLTLIAVAAILGLCIVSKVFERVSSSCEHQANQNRDTIGAVLVETFTNIQTVRSLTLEAYFHNKQAKLSKEAYSIAIRKGFYCGFLYGLSDATIKFVTAAIFAYGIYLARSASHSVEAIVAVCSLLLFGSASANTIVAYVPQVSSSVVAANRLLRLTWLPQSEHGHQSDTVDLKGLPPSVEFEKLTFYYPSRPKTAVLRNVSFTLPPNSCTAIVGASGSGKSTIGSLLMALYPSSPSVSNDNDSDAASILVSGCDIRTIPPSTLRRYIALVPQTPVIVPGTVRENILYGDLDLHLQTEFNMQDAAKAADIHDFIETLPDGYNTVVGGGGLGMSGGQAQRVVIARSLARRPKILILDEATSALDWECAEAVRSSIKRLTSSKRRSRLGSHGDSQHAITVIVITHAKEMIEWADHVIVMKVGAVAEQGTFQDLIQRKGDLWQMLDAGGVLNSNSE